MGDVSKRGYSAIEVLAYKHPVESLVYLGENQDFLAPWDVLEFHGCLPGASCG
jgi:hypothetical protein